MITGLFHASYTISNAEKSTLFCRDVLGLEETRWQVSDQAYLQGVTGYPGCSLRIGFGRPDGDPTSYEMVEYVQPRGRRAKTGFGIPGTMSIGWEVDHLEAAADRLSKAGVVIVGGPHPVDDGLWEGARGLFFLGPDDIPTELVEVKRQPAGKGRVLRLHHTSFSVTSIEKAMETLCGKLNLTLDLITTSQGLYWASFGRLTGAPMRKAYLSVPNTHFKIELLEYCTPAGPLADMATNNLASGHICFQVDDIHATYRDLTAIGVEFVGKPTEVTAGVNKGGFATYFKGIDGIRFELFQKPSAA